MRTIQHWIDGRTTVGEDSRRGPVFDPATGSEQAEVVLGSRADVQAAVAAAAGAAEAWRQTAVSKRAKVLFAFRELVHAHIDELARLITSEHGKVLDDARGEVQRGLEVVEFACGIPQLLKGEFSEQVSTGVDAYSFRQPLGVVAGITPFNFPAMVPMWMHPIAIACGNTFVLKPSERDPSAAILTAELWQRAGLPDGVFNVVHGDKEAVDALLDHPDVAAVSFVGSTPIARHVHQRASAAGKRVQALGGAKNHAVVLPDADLDFAADHITAAGYGSAGQRCMAISAVVAVGDSADKLVDKLAERARAVRVGAGSDPGSEMGPLVTAAARDRVETAVAEGVAAGAEVVVDGRSTRVAGYDDGFFTGPTLLDKVDRSMSVYTEELFGPVLVVLRANTFADAVRLVNDNPYGNGVAIFTNSGEAARTFQREVTVGMIGVNVPIPVPMAFYSFGGWKDSLFGDRHIHGPEGVGFYTRAKAITTRWPHVEAETGADFHFPTNG